MGEQTAASLDYMRGSSLVGLPLFLCTCMCYVCVNGRKFARFFLGVCSAQENYCSSSKFFDQCYNSNIQITFSSKSELIRVELEKARKEFIHYKSTDIALDKTFSYILLAYFFDVQNFDDKYDAITDGANDGGIDFLYFDEEDSKLFICQSKYTEAISYGEIKIEFDKICDTINNFRKSKTGSYNENLKRALQNALDRLPDDEQDNIEIILFTVADNIKDTEEIIRMLNNDIPELNKFTASIRVLIEKFL